MKNSTNQKRLSELLKDRRAFRATLIQRRNEIDIKISKVEESIRELSGVAK